MLERIPLKKRLNGGENSDLMRRFCLLYPEDICAAMERLHPGGRFSKLWDQWRMTCSDEISYYLAHLIVEGMPKLPPDAQRSILYTIMIELFTYHEKGVFYESVT